MSTGLTAGLDSRVTNEDSRPVPHVRLMRGWFTIRRAAGDGVELVTRIPGYLSEVTAHATQADATHAASKIYAAYYADVQVTIAEQETER